MSILPVIWHHCTPVPMPGLLGKGPAGVDLFFCISGFLITTLLLREKANTGRVELFDFYARRALRIFPLYYLLLVAYALFAWSLPSDVPARAHFFHTLPFYASFTANWLADSAVPHPILFAFAWSLCVEEQFYAFWPWLLRFLSGSQALWAMVLILAGGALVGRGFFSALWPATGYLTRVLSSFATPIGLGALLALLLDDPERFAWLHPLLARRSSAPILLVSVFALLIFASAQLFAFQIALTGLVGACVIRADNGLASALEARVPSYVGRVSYGLYLLHLTAIGCIRRLFPAHSGSAGFVFILSLPLALALAALSSRYLETPFLRLRSRFRAHKTSLELGVNCR
jgi:peptidoglycan/LPS O-acetylase OafA/YrhL